MRCGFTDGWFVRQRPSEARALVEKGEEIHAEDTKDFADLLSALHKSVVKGDNEIIKGLNNLGQGLNNLAKALSVRG